MSFYIILVLLCSPLWINAIHPRSIRSIHYSAVDPLTDRIIDPEQEQPAAHPDADADADPNPNPNPDSDPFADPDAYLDAPPNNPLRMPAIPPTNPLQTAFSIFDINHDQRLSSNELKFALRQLGTPLTEKQLLTLHFPMHYKEFEQVLK